MVRSDAIALAYELCTFCRGSALVAARGKHRLCGCVHRAVFRICYNRYRLIVFMQGAATAQVRLERSSGGTHRTPIYSLPNEEFLADFTLIARRTLNRADYRVFDLHYLQGLTWRECCPRLGLDKGNFFHAVYSIEQKLGQAFRETEPYPLFPLDRYFTQIHASKKAEKFGGISLAA